VSGRSSLALAFACALACGAPEDVVDAGAIADAGMAIDAGRSDAGTADDAGGAIDAGPDAGGVDAGGSVDAGGPIDAGPPTWDDLSDRAETIRAEHGLIALGGAVVDSNGALAIGVAGRRRVESDERVELDDRWHLGSDTKAMTATLAAMFVEDGAIAWDTPVTSVFSSFSTAIHADLRSVTMVHLFNHRSGLTGDLLNEFPSIWSTLWQNQGAIDAQRLWFSEEMLTIAPVVQLESAYVYSNAGFMVAGAMLEQRSGTTWEAAMRSRLFDPLGMASCGFGVPGSAGLVDEPRGHTLSPLASTQIDNPPALGPAGTVHCSLEDWGLFASLHLRGSRADTALLSRASFDRLHTPPSFEPGYAYGWGVTSRTWAGGTVYTHNGSNTMWFAVIWLAPAIDRAYLAVTNIAGDDAFYGTDAMIGALIAAYP
jgi:CubicO group peptidase (beta-lactamase class C family)